jgi:hypothetical protein
MEPKIRGFGVIFSFYPDPKGSRKSRAFGVRFPFCPSSKGSSKLEGLVFNFRFAPALKGAENSKYFIKVKACTIIGKNS